MKHVLVCDNHPSLHSINDGEVGGICVACEEQDKNGNVPKQACCSRYKGQDDLNSGYNSVTYCSFAETGEHKDDSTQVQISGEEVEHVQESILSDEGLEDRVLAGCRFVATQPTDKDECKK